MYSVNSIMYSKMSKIKHETYFLFGIFGAKLPNGIHSSRHFFLTLIDMIVITSMNTTRIIRLYTTIHS